jgi:pantothenate kinase
MLKYLLSDFSSAILAIPVCVFLISLTTASSTNMVSLFQTCWSYWSDPAKVTYFIDHIMYIGYCGATTLTFFADVLAVIEMAEAAKS